MKIGIVAPCTATKRGSGPGIDLGRVADGTADLADRFEVWRECIDGVEGVPDALLPAADLYAGATWAATRRLFDAGGDVGLATSARVASAGLGVVRLDEALPRYGATFASGAEDSISRRSGSAVLEDHRRWWDLVCEWRGTSLRAFAEEVTLLVVALTPAYLGAVEADLRRAGEVAPLLVLSTSVPSDAALSAMTVSVRQRLRAAGGLVRASDQSLVMAVAERVIREFGPRWGAERNGGLDPGHDEIRAFLDRSMGQRRRNDKPRTSPEELRGFIRAELRRDPSVSRTALHQRLRADRQVSAERFREAFDIEVANLSPSLGGHDGR